MNKGKDVYESVYFDTEYWRKSDPLNWLVHEIHCVSKHFTDSFLLHFEKRINSYYNSISGTKRKGLIFHLCMLLRGTDKISCRGLSYSKVGV